MTAHRKLAVLAVIGVAPVLLTALAAAPAAAHGGMVNPVSRAAACGTEGGQDARSNACTAALAAGGPQMHADWDNLRVAGVRGQDRQLIPDGKLCSGGLERFQGLDLPRADWPATTLTAGTAYRFTYRGTIPHKGTFRLYVTTDGYEPSQLLRWSDLEQEPFLTVTDPPLKNGSYRINGRLPEAKTGRHLIYTVWQNSDTPDTYYSCSDVVFAGTPARGSASAVPEAPASQPVVGADSADPAPEASRAASHKDSIGRSTLLLTAGAAALLGAGVVAVAVVLFRRRRS
jgi:predicted carbohydrate-binding protein with CBM5 and CBM33 domain